MNELTKWLKKEIKEYETMVEDCEEGRNAKENYFKSKCNAFQSVILKIERINEEDIRLDELIEELTNEMKECDAMKEKCERHEERDLLSAKNNVFQSVIWKVERIIEENCEI